MTTPNVLSARSLKPALEELGYTGDLLRADFRIGPSAVASLAGFAQEPIDARTACVAVTDALDDPREAVASLRDLGAPIVLVCHAQQLQFWKETVDGPERVEDPIPPAGVSAFFRRHRQDFSPDVVYRAKTWGRFDAAHQITFVDRGLMTAVEGEIGEALGRLIERNVSGLKSTLKWNAPSDQQGQWLLKSVFWLVAAKILRDKEVPGFRDLDLLDIEAVFSRLASHYGSDHPVPVSGRRQREALRERASDIQRFATLAHVSTESLAYVYENTLISRETRQALGTHSTPAYLVDYVVGKLVDFIEEIPAERRNVFEPACGHAAFLVAAMRLLRELLPTGMTAAKRRRYLRTQLHGCDIDLFALEIARLSLTLADIPNPDGWDLQPIDLFAGDVVRDASRSATLLLANPPFENFTSAERQTYAKKGMTIQQNNKTAELLLRTLPHLPAGAAFGVVVPQGILHSNKAAALRQFLLTDCELKEICLFPDKVFNKSDVESAVILGRRHSSKRPKPVKVNYRRVRESDMDEFRRSYSVSTKRDVSASRFQESNQWDLLIPDLEEVWMWCDDLRFEDIARIGQGLAFKGGSLPENAITYQKDHFSGASRGYVHFGHGLQTHSLPEEYWLNLSPDVLLHKRTGVETEVPQVLLNYARVSRGPWRLKALIDRSGHAVTSRFLTVRPRSSDTSLEFLWALCNSPFANAYAYAHSMKRDILAGTMRRMPVPVVRPNDIERVTEAALAYLRAVTPNDEALRTIPEPAILRQLLLQMDAEVLRLYALPPRLERQLLDLFAGCQRQGIPSNVTFDHYLSPDFEPCFPLHEYLSAKLQQSTAGKLRAAHRPIVSREWSAAMQETLDSFQE